MRKCIICKKKEPTFNYEGESRATHCKECSLPDMVNVKSPKCIICKKKRPNFNYEGESRATHCKECSLPDMVNVKSPKCIICKKKEPTFNYEGETKVTHCKECSLPDMIDVKHPKCIICKKKHPNFNYEGESRATHCKECSLPDMVNVKSPKCIICKKKRPNFNYEGESKATHCKECSLPDMVDIKNPKCIICKKKQPNFNYEGESRATHCKECSLPDMIDVNHPKCIVCKKKRPNFNYEGESKATHCKECSLPDMIDVNHPKCIVCKKRASYGFPHNIRSSCAQHKKEGMIRNPRAKCRKKDCSEIASYGITAPIHCEDHKNDNDINLVERICEKCGKLDVLLNGVCVNFCLYSEKNNIYKKSQKVKEKRILTLLTAKFGEPTEYNRKVDYECGQRNAEEKEIGYDCGTHVIYIEVDERQHKSYCEQGEVNRMKNIYFDSGGIPVIFIRYNPDNFIDENKKRQNISQADREELLFKWIKYHMEHIPKRMLTVQYLFYDGSKENNNIRYSVDPYDSKCYTCKKCKKDYYIGSIYKVHIERHHK